MNIRNALVFRIGNLGDTLVALPAFWRLRSVLGDAKLTLLSNGSPKGTHHISPKSVIDGAGIFDEFIDYPTGLGKVSLNLAIAKLALRLKQRRFDAVLYLMPRARSTAQINRDLKFFKLVGIKNVLGVDHLRKNIIPLPLEPPIQKVHSETEHLLSQLSDIGFSQVGDDRFDVGLTDAEIRFANLWIDKHGIVSTHAVAVAPGTKWESKRWESFGPVVERLIAEHNITPVIFGGPEDKNEGERLIASWKRGINAAGELTIREAAGVLSHCSFYLGNDTGTMHLAASAGIKCVGIFAAIDLPGRWSPAGSGHVIFRRSVACEGCHSPECNFEKKCLRQIDAGTVYEACSRMLSTDRAAESISK